MEVNGIGQVFERVVEGMRNEMSTVLWRIERSRDSSPEALKKLIKTGLEAMVGAVEKVMYGVSNGLEKEWKEKEQDEEARKARADRESREGEEGKRKVEESWMRIEDKLERKIRETEERWKGSEERLTNVEQKLERDVNRRMEEEKRGEGCMRNIGGHNSADRSVDRNETLEERVESLEDKIKNGEKHVRMEDREAHARIDKLESDMARDRIERQGFEWNEKEDIEIQDTKESEREMERKLEGAMEQMKILNLDFGRQCTDKRTLVKDAISKIKEKLVDSKKEEFDRIMKGTRVDILGKGTGDKETEKGSIYTVPVLFTCGCRSVKERLEMLMRKSGLTVAFQWPKECMDFVDKICEEVDKMGYGKKEYYTKGRPEMVEGRAFLKAEVKKKEGGKFVGVAYSIGGRHQEIRITGKV